MNEPIPHLNENDPEDTKPKKKLTRNESYYLY